MSEELLPCPFCGSADIGLAKKFVFCQACGAEAGFGDGSPNIAAWNTRPALIDHLEADGGVEASKGPSAEHLQIALAKCEEERDEAVNWSHLVDRHGTDDFDELAERWLAMEPVQRMHQAVGSVFAQYSNDAIMARFRQHMSDIMQTAFVEGCLVGVRAEMAKASALPVLGVGR